MDQNPRFINLIIILLIAFWLMNLVKDLFSKVHLRENFL